MAGIKLLPECSACRWRVPLATPVKVFEAHCRLEHAEEEVTLDLVAVCDCGATMSFAGSRPTGGGVFDYFTCGDCGAMGRLFRDPMRAAAPNN